MAAARPVPTTSSASCPTCDARTEAELRADLRLRLTGTEAGLIAYYPLDATHAGGGKVHNKVTGEASGQMQGTARLLLTTGLPAAGTSDLVTAEYSTVGATADGTQHRQHADQTDADRLHRRCAARAVGEPDHRGGLPRRPPSATSRSRSPRPDPSRLSGSRSPRRAPGPSAAVSRSTGRTACCRRTSR